MTAWIPVFLLFLMYGCFCLSGGSSLLQFYIDDLVNARHWMTLDELGNLVAVSQVTPGPIGVNLATFLGFTRAGFFGGLAATVGLLIPSFFLMMLAVRSYARWRHSGLLRSAMYSLKPVTLALVLTAFFASLGMSVFTTPIPFDRWLGTASGAEEVFALRPALVPLLPLTGWLLWTKRLSIFAVVMLSAAVGVLFALLGWL